MRLVSRDCVRISFYDTFTEEMAAYERGNKKQANYFNELRVKMMNSRESKFDSYEDAYINIHEPSFQALGFDISEMEITGETILNAFVIAAYSGNYMMVEKIKPYLKKYSYLYDELPEDAREYILDNGISIEEYLENQDENEICASEGNKPTDKTLAYSSIDDMILSYECFLKEVYDYTIFYAKNVIEGNGGHFQVVDIEGAEFEFKSWKQGVKSGKCKHTPGYPDYSKYPEDVIQRALQEVPIIELWPESSWRYKRDFKNSPIKLGVLVKECVGTSGLIELGLFMSKLKESGIETMIDFERQQLHINLLKTINSEGNKHSDKVHKIFPPHQPR